MNEDITKSQVYQELELSDEEREALKAEVPFTLEDIPVHFTTAEELKQFVAGMVFFTQNLHPIADRMNALQATTPPSVILQMQRELMVISRLLTIHRYELLPAVTKEWYKKKITADNPVYEGKTEEILGITKMGVHMDQAEWELYYSVFTELYELHEGKVAPPVLGPSDEELNQMN